MAICYVVEEFSSIDDQSKYFKSDVLQFLHSKRSMVATQTISPIPKASTVSTEVKCCTQSLFISFYHRKEDFVELMAKVDLGFVCSVCILNDSLACLDLLFSTFVFYSAHDSVLGKCNPTSFSLSVLGISFSQSIDGKNELGLCLSSVDIWLRLSEWTEVVKFLNNFHANSEKTQGQAITNSFPMNASESTSLPFTSEEIKNDVLIIKSENVCITFHIPVLVGEEACVELQHAEGLSVKPSSVSSDIVEAKDAKLVSVSFNMNGFELVIRGIDIQLKSKMDKISSVLIIVEDGKHMSWPLLDVIQVDVVAVLCKNHPNGIKLNVEIICDNANIWISHPAIYSWGAVKFDVLESGSSQNSTSAITFKFCMRKVSILITDGRVC